jgi:hypothetical protein
MSNSLLSFEAEQARRGAYTRGDRGLQLIDVHRVVGSVGRADALDGRFRYRRGQEPKNAESRLRRLRALFESGRVPPLDVYQIGDDYFVVDGHHRVRVAWERGQIEIEAHVVEYLPDRTDPADAVYNERRAFVRATRLEEVHATEPGRYPRLLSRIQDHRHELTREHAAFSARMRPRLPGPLSVPPSDDPPDLRAAARDWYEREFLPVAEVLRAERLAASFPGRALGDLYGYVCDHRWYLSERRGWDVGVDEALLDFVHRHAPDPSAEALVDPVVALGSDVLDRAPDGWLAPLRGLVADVRVALVAGLLALPLAFLRGLRPRDYGFPRPAAE